jgi:hypothetical protein
MILHFFVLDWKIASRTVEYFFRTFKSIVQMPQQIGQRTLEIRMNKQSRIGNRKVTDKKKTRILERNEKRINN